MQILIVEKDNRLAKAIEVVLVAIADIVCINNGEDAITRVQEQHFDMIITELALGNMGGIEFIKDIRESGDMPIIVVSHIDDVDKKIECLNAGADDYIVKPLSVDELLARVRALLRRCNTGFTSEHYRHGNMEINYNNKMLNIDGNYVELNRKTYEILELLVRNREIIMTKQQIFDRVWGYYSSTVQTVVEINIFRLRKVLAEYGLDKCLRTVKSTGYMWTIKGAK